MALRSAARVTALLSVTACLLHGSALAGVVEGAVVFPGPTLAAARIYARNLDSGALHDTTLRRGERTFRLELPAGRYWFFMRPLDQGLTELYGALTQYSLCRSGTHEPQDGTESGSTGDCTDHSLLEVEVPAGGTIDLAAIDDWFLHEAQAEILDRIVGAAAGPPDDAELGRPRFSEYRVSMPETLAPAGLEPIDEPAASLLAAQLAATGGRPNFAGSFSLARLPCGEACEQVAVLELGSGTVHFPEPLGRLAPAPQCRPERSLDFREDSRLLEYTHQDGDTVVTDYLLWESERRAFRAIAQYRRSVERFCSDSAS